MTFTAYIERQKSIIRSRHDGETFLIEKGEVFRLEQPQTNDSEKILNDLHALKGLNTYERMNVRRRVW